jgi:FkbM family methyltransferase
MVALCNEYRLPPSLAPDDVVIDIGAHIGSFSYAAYQRGSRQIYAFEAEPDNYAAMRANLSGHEGVELAQRAVWRSDVAVATLKLTPSAEAANRGGGSTIWGKGAEVDAVPFDAVVDAATDGGKQRVRLLKIDCEGSEFPILMTSNRLHLIDEIAGEFHEYGNDDATRERTGVQEATLEALTSKLEAGGLQVYAQRNRRLPALGWFYASRLEAFDAAVRLSLSDRAWRTYYGVRGAVRRRLAA